MQSPLRPSAKDALIEAAYTVLSQNPGASLSEVAERAGVGRATLHRHFAGRDDLVRALAQLAIREMDEAVDAACEGAQTQGDALRLSLEALIPLGDRHGFLAREPLENDPEIAAEFDRQLRETQEVVKAAQEEGVFDRAVPVAWITQAYDHLLYAAWESVKAGETTPAQAAGLAWRTLTHGLKEPSS